MPTDALPWVSGGPEDDDRPCRSAVRPALPMARPRARVGFWAYTNNRVTGHPQPVNLSHHRAGPVAIGAAVAAAQSVRDRATVVARLARPPGSRAWWGTSRRTAAFPTARALATADCAAGALQPRSLMLLASRRSVGPASRIARPAASRGPGTRSRSNSSTRPDSGRLVGRSRLRDCRSGGGRRYRLSRPAPCVGSNDSRRHRRVL